MIQTFEFYGQGRQIDAKGRHFRYEAGADGGGITDIELTIDGNRIGRLSPGDDITLPSEATRWEIRPVSSGCTGTVRVGNARITSSKVKVDGALTNAELRAQSLRVTDFPMEQTGDFKTLGGLAANTAMTVFTPAQNTSGVILLDARTWIYIASGTTGVCALVAKDGAAPTSIEQGEMLFFGRVAGQHFGDSLSMSQWVKPGHGLYWIANAGFGASTHNVISCRWAAL